MLMLNLKANKIKIEHPFKLWFLPSKYNSDEFCLYGLG